MNSSFFVQIACLIEMHHTSGIPYVSLPRPEGLIHGHYVKGLREVVGY